MFCESGHLLSPSSPSISAEAPRTHRFQQASTPMLVLMWNGSLAPHFHGQLLWSRPLLPHPLAPFLDRPYALLTWYFLQDPHVSVGFPALITTLYLELLLWHFSAARTCSLRVVPWALTGGIFGLGLSSGHWWSRCHLLHLSTPHPGSASCLALLSLNE